MARKRKNQPKRKAERIPRPVREHITKYERRYIDAVNNPFGEEAVGVRLPSASSRKTIPVTLQFEGFVINQDNQALYTLSLRRNNGTEWNAPTVRVFTGDTTGSPDAESVVTCSKSTTIDAYGTSFSDGYNWRVVAAGLKIWPQALSTEDPGYLVGGNIDQPIETADGVYNTYAVMRGEMEDTRRYDGDAGITVRWRPTDTGHRWIHESDTGQIYSTNGISWPTVYQTGVTSGMTTNILAVVHLEVECEGDMLASGKYSPLTVRGPLLAHMIGTQPIVVAGHSFKSFVKNIPEYTRRAIEYAELVGAIALLL